jgi:NADH-quinone oxidoreductase subunit K
MLGPGVAWYVAAGSAVFAIGAAGVMLRRNPLIMLLSLELMLNGANLVLIAFARQSGSQAGQVFALSVMAVAAAEVVVGLGLVVAMARKKIEIDIDLLSRMRG